MRIINYSYNDDPITKTGWEITPVEFTTLNLIVGISGAGKTKLLNTISNIAPVIRGKAKTTGAWNLVIEQNNQIYEWDIFIQPIKDELPKIKFEKLTLKNGEEKVILIDRSDNGFFFNGDQLPKLPSDESAIVLLKEEDAIRPLYEGFDYFIRREFSIESLKEAAQKHLINFETKESVKYEKNLKKLVSLESLNDRLEIIKNSFEDIYNEICENFINTFPFIRRVDLKKLNSPFGLVPIFCIKEKNVDDWIPLDQISSGMKKILFMLTDICSLPEGSIYFIDEYENSLGINAINFLPEFLSDYQDKIQFFITSHHPYLINNIPGKNWYLCYRKGQNIFIKYGKELVDRYGESKQSAFVNLINDTIYSEGIE